MISITIKDHTMKRRDKSEFFNWSRTPSSENIHAVYIASPNSYVEFNRGITKDEFVKSLNTYTELQELKSKKEFLKFSLAFTIASIPFIILFYNVIWKYL
jgi:hypothetical protein